MKKKSIFEQHPKKTLAIVICVGLLIVVSATETLLRQLSPVRAGIDRNILLREHAPYKEEYFAPGAGNLRKTDTLAKKKYRLSVDENGFIKPSKLYENPDYEVVFLGGSTTENFYVEQEMRFPNYTRILLEKKTGKKINAYNSGNSGNNTLHSLNILLNKIVPMQPDAAILMHNINDLVILIHYNTYWNNNLTKAPIQYAPSGKILLKKLTWSYIPGISRHIFKPLAALLSPGDEFAKVRHTKKSFEQEALLKMFKQNLVAFVSLCRIQEITPILMTQSNRFKSEPDPIIMQSNRTEKLGISYPELVSLYRGFNESIRKVAKQENVLLIDLDTAIPQSSEYLYDDVHYNTKGSIRASEVIAAHLLPLIQ